MKRLALALCACFLMSLTACSGPSILFRTPEELYALPKASEEYTMLQKELQELLDQGLEYAPPVSGSNTQPVRLSDLDGDGEPEAMAFFRDTSADASPLKIYIFRQNADGEFEKACVIEGDGSEINSVLLCQIVGESTVQELVVSWQMSNATHAVYTLTAYSLVNWEPVELMPSVSYTRYVVTDLDSDEEDELILMSVEPGETAISTATCYDRSGERLEAVSTANLSSRVSAIEKVKDGLLRDGTPVVYVSGSVVDKSGGTASQITDVLTLKEGRLCNITLNSDTLNSDTTLRYAITGGRDVNNDGVLEIPHPYPLHSFEKNNTDLFYAIDWQQYEADGSYSVVFTTYYNNADGWYLVLPDRWKDCVALSRQDVTSGSTNERAIMFYETHGNGKWEPFLAIYKNTGSNRVERSSGPERIRLYGDSSTIYTMELLKSDSELMLTEAEAKANFHLIVTDWSTD